MLRQRVRGSRDAGKRRQNAPRKTRGGRRARRRAEQRRPGARSRGARLSAARERPGARAAAAPRTCVSMASSRAAGAAAQARKARVRQAAPAIGAHCHFEKLIAKSARISTLQPRSAPPHSADASSPPAHAQKWLGKRRRGGQTRVDQRTCRRQRHTPTSGAEPSLSIEQHRGTNHSDMGDRAPNGAFTRHDITAAAAGRPRGGARSAVGEAPLRQDAAGDHAVFTPLDGVCDGWR